MICLMENNHVETKKKQKTFLIALVVEPGVAGNDLLNGKKISLIQGHERVASL